MPQPETVAKVACGAAVISALGIEVARDDKVAKCVKAIVKDHPVVFGFCCAAVLISEIIYKIYKSSQNKEGDLKYSSDDGTTKHHENIIYVYDSETKSVTDSAAPVSNDSDSNLRKSHVNRSASSTTSENRSEKSTAPVSYSSNNLSEKSNEKKNICTVAKEVQTDPIDINQNFNDKKILPDKNLTAMSAQEKVSEFLSRNTLDAENSESDTMSNPEQEVLSQQSDSSNWSNISSAKSSDNSERKKHKEYKKKVHRSFKKYVDTMIQENCESLSAENSDTSSSSSVSSSSSWSNISSEKSTDDFEKNYKKKMYRTLKKFVKNMNKTETSRPSSECSSTSIESESSSGSLLSEEPEKCIACEENPVNTYVQPCNHRYMCSDCAMKIFKLYKKCKICHAKIEKVVVED